MSLITLEKIKVNEVINKRNAYKAIGYKLFERLENVINSKNKPKLLILDFRELDLLTYSFIEVALKGLVKYTIRNNDLIVLYEINKFELEELITGIIDMLKLQSKNKEKLNEQNLLAEHYFIAYRVNEETVEYIGRLNDVEKDILKIIEEKGETSHNEIDEYLKSVNKSNYCEDIAKSVSRLFKLGFIFQVKKTDNVPSHYYSLTYLQNHED